MEPTTSKPQSFKGVVVKTAMKDTATVAVSRYVKHPKYKKYQTRTKKYLAHDRETRSR
jgi:small subunit ribosomal protein S17